MLLVMRGRVAVLVGVAALLLCAAAVAANRAYVLKRPAHEHCKSHYVRQVKHAGVRSERVREVWCVYVESKPKPLSPTPSPAPNPASALSPAPSSAPTEERKPAVTYCSPPVFEAPGPGMGEVTGSAYLAGGPAPGVFECASGVVWITTPSGALVTSMEMHGHESFAFALPVGPYLVHASPNPDMTDFVEPRPVYASEHAMEELTIVFSVP